MCFFLEKYLTVYKGYMVRCLDNVKSLTVYEDTNAFLILAHVEGSECIKIRLWFVW